MRVVMWLCMGVLGALTACRSVEPRPAASSYGCMRVVRDHTVAETGAASDKHLHCVVSANIARQCSVAEAYLAGLGKELKDLLMPGGDAEWTDWQADRAGVDCSRDAGAAMADCCATRGF